MAEMNFFVTETEYSALLRVAMNSGFRLLLDKNNPYPKREYVLNNEDLLKILGDKQYAYFLERDDFTRYPIKLRPIERNGVTLWYPRSKEGGPVIEIYFFAPYETEGKRIVPASLIAARSTFVNPETGREEQSGDAIARAFNTIVSPLKKGFRRVKSVKRTAYISPEIQTLIRSGWTLGPPFDAVGQL